MRRALDIQHLKHIYDHIAGHYDLQHAFFTAGSDHRGRKIIVDQTVKPGDHVLDCGAGTGSTAFLASKKIAPGGIVTLFDLSGGLLNVAKKKAEKAGINAIMDFQTGDMHALPFSDNQFDVVLSTYSLCPLYDPTHGAMEIYRVVKPGGLIGICHSTEPASKFTAWLAQKIENVVWLLPYISLGCRSVSVLPALEQAGAQVVFKKRIGVPLWPFLLFVVKKTDNR